MSKRQVTKKMSHPFDKCLADIQEHKVKTCRDILSHCGIKSCTFLGQGAKGVVFHAEGPKGKGIIIKFVESKSGSSDEAKLSHELRSLLRKNGLCEDMILNIFLSVPCEGTEACDGKGFNHYFPGKPTHMQMFVAEYIRTDLETELKSLGEILNNSALSFKRPLREGDKKLSSLDQTLNTQLRRFAGFMTQILLGLELMLKAGHFVHNDLKPDNIRIQSVAKHKLSMACSKAFACSLLLTSGDVIVFTDFDRSSFIKDAHYPFLFDLRLLACAMISEWSLFMTEAQTSPPYRWDKVKLLVNFLNHLFPAYLLETCQGDFDGHLDQDEVHQHKWFVCCNSETGRKKFKELKAELMTVEQAIKKLQKLRNDPFLHHYLDAVSESCPVQQFMKTSETGTKIETVPNLSLDLSSLNLD